jgi:hypothetical protein
VIQQQHQLLANRQANALERIITKISQNVINKICADWASMETNQASVKWQQSESIIMNLIQSGFSERQI